MNRRSLPAPVLHDLANRAADYGLSRRTFFSLLGAVGGGAFLTSCGTSPDSINVSGGKRGILRWASYPGYIDASTDSGTTSPTLNQFERQSKIQVTYNPVIEDEDTFFGSVRGMLGNAQDIGYDVVVLSEQMTGRWVRLGYANQLDPAKIADAKNLIPSLNVPSLAKLGTHSFPWQGGFAVLAWNKNKVKDLHNVSDLWNPDLKGKVEVLSDFRHTIGLVMQDQGVDPGGNWGDDEFYNALDVIKTNISNGQIRKSATNDYMQDLKSKDAWAVMGWSGDIFQLNLDAGEEVYKCAIPEKGGTIYADQLVSPFTSAQVDSVEKLVNFYYDPTVAAELEAYLHYVCPVAGAQAVMEKTHPDLADSEWIFPSSKVLSTVSFIRWLNDDEYQRYANAYSAVTGS